MIENLSNIIRPQRAGKIYLGTRVRTNKVCSCSSKTKDHKINPNCDYCLGTGFMHRPKETSHFVVKESEAPEIYKIYGESPTILNVTLPRSYNIDDIFPQHLKLYGRSGAAKCIGTGKTARRVNPVTATLEDRECPCEEFVNKKCKARATLNFKITENEASFLVYQVSTGSFNSIVNLNTAIREIIFLCLRHGLDIADIKLVLGRKKEKTTHLDPKKQTVTRGTHYIMFLDLDRRFYSSWKDVVDETQKLPIGRPDLIGGLLSAPPLPDNTRDDVMLPPPETNPEIYDGEGAIEMTPEKVEDKAQTHQEAKKEASPIDRAQEEEIDQPGPSEGEKTDSQVVSDKEYEEAMEKVEKEVKERDKKIKDDPTDLKRHELNTLIMQLAALGGKTTDKEQTQMMEAKTTAAYDKLIEHFKERTEEAKKA